MDKDEKCDIFCGIDFSGTGMWIKSTKSLSHPFNLNYDMINFFLEKQDEIISGVTTGNVFSYEKQMYNQSPREIMVINNSGMARYMVDIRMWIKNVIGRLTPTKLGFRLHHLHIVNLFKFMKAMMESEDDGEVFIFE